LKLAILGGTFDPIHIGHLHVADEAAHSFGYSKVLFIPSFISAHKQRGEWKKAEHRLKMIEHAIAGVSWAGVDDCEIKREGVSYSVETVREISERYELSEPPGLIIGDDLLDGFYTWKEVDTLISSAEIIIANRKKDNSSKVDFPHRTLDNLYLPISSTDIRKRIKEKKPFRFLLSKGVYEYVLRHKLYR